MILKLKDGAMPLEDFLIAQFDAWLGDWRNE
jgi:hypothetical protein